MDIKLKLEFYDFINEIFKGEPTDEVKNKVLNKFEVVIQKDEEKAKDVSRTHINDLISAVFPYNIGDVIYHVNECVGKNYRGIGIFKDTINAVTIKINSKEVTYHMYADLIDFDVTDNKPQVNFFKKFSEAKIFATELAKKENLEIIAFS